MSQPAEAFGIVRPDAAPVLTVGGQPLHGSAMTAPSNGQPSFASHPVSVRRFPPPARDAVALVVHHAVEDYVPNESELARLQGFVPLSDSRHYRMQAAGPFGSGEFEFCGLADGFFVIFADMALDGPQTGYLSAPEMLQVIVASNGDGEYVTPRGDPLSFEGPSTTLIIEPAGQPSAEATFAGEYKYAHVVIHRDALRALYAGGEHDLPPVLQAFVDGSLQQTVARTMPLGPTLLRCLEDLRACGLEGRRRRLFLQSKAVEILCHAFEGMDHEDSFGSAESSMVTARSVMKAQLLLMENFITPPNLEDLAHAVGLSRSGLCAGFRQILGQSVFEYIQDLRMRQALALLNERDASITQIAYAVGYNHASSFSVAVQRHFGATPTELRRRGGLAAA
jgi:AraC family transcriptional activator of pyochelin receptor